jgi:hypothetical protein
MRFAIVFLLFASSAFAQNHSAAPAVPASCGSLDIQFDVKQDRTQHALAQPEASKALVYVIEEFEELPGGFITPTIRVGVDGSWVGATKGTSFLFFSVDPGEHHLCANWQSSSSQISKQYSLTSFTAESGKVYFFKVAPQVEAFHAGGNAWRKDLAPVDVDEANYLISISFPSVSHPHN